MNNFINILTKIKYEEEREKIIIFLIRWLIFPLLVTTKFTATLYINKKNRSTRFTPLFQRLLFLRLN